MNPDRTRQIWQLRVALLFSALAGVAALIGWTVLAEHWTIELISRPDSSLALLQICVQASMFAAMICLVELWRRGGLRYRLRTLLMVTTALPCLFMLLAWLGRDLRFDGVHLRVSGPMIGVGVNSNAGLIGVVQFDWPLGFPWPYSLYVAALAVWVSVHFPVRVTPTLPRSEISFGVSDLRSNS